MSANDNREEGKGFEKIFEVQCRYKSLNPKKNHPTARFKKGGGFLLEKGDLDFKVIQRPGRVGYVDCKSFGGTSFTYSELDKRQVERAVEYSEWGVPAGFVVWHRGNNEVVFYSAHKIAFKGPRSNFSTQDGVSLGTLQNFDPRLIFAQGRGTLGGKQEEP